MATSKVLSEAIGAGFLSGNSSGTILGNTVNFADSTQIGTASSLGMRNRIINGGMDVWQRGTTGTSTSYGCLSADRWSAGPFGVNTALSQSASAPTGFQYSLKVQRPLSGTNTSTVVAMQTIESVNCYDLSGQAVTISFWAKAGANYSASGNALGFQLITGTVADQGGSTSVSYTHLTLPTNREV